MRITTAAGGFRARNERGFPLCQHQDPTKEDRRVKEWWRCEAKHRISHHPLRPAGAQPLMLAQSVFVVLVILSVWMSIWRRVDSRESRKIDNCSIDWVADGLFSGNGAYGYIILCTAGAILRDSDFRHGQAFVPVGVRLKLWDSRRACS